MFVLKIVLKVLATAIREEKEIKWIQTGRKDVQLSLFADEKILYKENPKNATKTLLELINEFGEVARYKINIQKSVVFLYTNSKLSEKKVKETISFSITSKRKNIN